MDWVEVESKLHALHNEYGDGEYCSSATDQVLSPLNNQVNRGGASPHCAISPCNWIKPLCGSFARSLKFTSVYFQLSRVIGRVSLQAMRKPSWLTWLFKGIVGNAVFFMGIVVGTAFRSFGFVVLRLKINLTKSTEDTKSAR